MRTLICTILAATVALVTSGAMAHSIKIVGHLEDAVVLPMGLPIKAKMDTGADIALIHAVDIERYRQDGEEWVRFTLKSDGRTETVRRPLVRIARIRFAGSQVAERPVVRLRLCIAGYSNLAQIIPIDRSRMRVPLLIGKRFMSSGGLVVDSSSEHIGRPVCD